MELTNTPTLETTNLPVVVIIPEAFHVEGHYARFVDQLGDHGFVVTCQTHPSFTYDPQDLATYSTDVNRIYCLIFDLASEGHDIILIAHGMYGGFVSTEACSTLTKTWRSKAGMEGGVTGVLYISAYLPDVGDWFNHPKRHPDEIDWTNLLVWTSQGTHLLDPENLLFNDVGANEAKHWAKTLFRNQTNLEWVRVFDDPEINVLWKHVPSIYLVSSNNNFVPETLQRAMLDNAYASGYVLEKLVHLDSGHNPQISQVDNVIKAVIQLAKRLKEMGLDSSVNEHVAMPEEKGHFTTEWTLPRPPPKLRCSQCCLHDSCPQENTGWYDEDDDNIWTLDEQ